jgi:hypothetical protein
VTVTPAEGQPMSRVVVFAEESLDDQRIHRPAELADSKIS